MRVTEQVAHRVCGVSITGDAQNSTGRSSEQPALAEPALSRGAGLGLQSSLPASLCKSEIHI